MVDRLSPIDQRLEGTVTRKTKQPQTEDADAFASGRAIGDNGSTMKETDACASGRAIGDNGSTMKETDACASGRAIGDNGSTNRPTINADSKAISSSMRSRQ